MVLAVKLILEKKDKFSMSEEMVNECLEVVGSYAKKGGNFSNPKKIAALTIYDVSLNPRYVRHGMNRITQKSVAKEFGICTAILERNWRDFGIGVGLNHIG